VKAIVGASGGANIIPGTAEVFMNHFVKGMNPFSAVVAPRFYHQVEYLTPFSLHFLVIGGLKSLIGKNTFKRLGNCAHFP